MRLTSSSGVCVRGKTATCWRSTSATRPRPARGSALPGDNNPDSQTTQFGATIVNGQIAYIASSTANGGSTQDGVGRVLVVDYSDPADPTDPGRSGHPRHLPGRGRRRPGRPGAGGGQDGGQPRRRHQRNHDTVFARHHRPANPHWSAPRWSPTRSFPTSASGSTKTPPSGWATVCSR